MGGLGLGLGWAGIPGKCQRFPCNSTLLICATLGSTVSDIHSQALHLGAGRMGDGAVSFSQPRRPSHCAPLLLSPDDLDVLMRRLLWARAEVGGWLLGRCRSCWGHSQWWRAEGRVLMEPPKLTRRRKPLPESPELSGQIKPGVTQASVGAPVSFSSVQFRPSVVSDSLRPQGLQHTRPPCPSPTPGLYSNPSPSCRWCHPAVSSSVVPFSRLHLAQHQGLCKWVSSSHQVLSTIQPRP